MFFGSGFLQNIEIKISSNHSYCKMFMFKNLWVQKISLNSIKRIQLKDNLYKL
jgi:hypothetical protein